MAQEKANVVPGPPSKALKSNKKAAPAFVKYYLFAYNVLSTIGWAYILIFTIIHVFDLDGKSTSITSSSSTASSTLGRLFSSIPFIKSTQKFNTVGGLEARLHPLLVPVYRRAATTFGRIGVTTAWVQSCALLEVVHVLLGWVRSPLQTTAMQVSSRLFLVWGIVEQFASVRSNPLYTSMVFAWRIFGGIFDLCYTSINISNPELVFLDNGHVDTNRLHSCNSILDLVARSIYYVHPYGKTKA
ncbi:PTPLA-domain-containing protein [Lentinula edodes]|uniref:Very-long-chain (3R)-3-hydroxyacyl-CoA dehydratase n=1 Tax=Lentinula edodes TaxID=5353 RepID=A0A1Q3E9Y7_LENED|nr:PTPLA-domain-containing protein [Lentinula edodes]